MEDIETKGKFLCLLNNIYKETWNSVWVKEEASTKFKTNNGVPQDCQLSPLTFNITISDLEATFRKKNVGGLALGSATNTGLNIFTLLYVDGVAIMAEDGKDLSNMIQSLEKWTKKNKLEVNCDKTKIMISCNGGNRKKENWKFKGNQIEVH